MTTEDFNNVTDSGTAPKRRIATPHAARAIFEKLCDDDQQREFRRARLKGLVDGNRPYSEADLRRIGQGGRTNVNFREAESIIDSRVAADYELLVEVPALIECEFDFKIGLSSVDENEYEQIIASEYTSLMHNWSGFYYNCNMISRDSNEYGLGYAVWPDEWDWRSRAFPRANIKFPDTAPYDAEDNDLFCLVDEMKVSDLFALFEDEETSKDIGWNLPEVKRALIQKFKGGSIENNLISEWEEIQRKVRDMSPDIDRAEFEGLKVIKYLVKEANGAISYYIMPGFYDAESWMFKAEDRYATMNQVIALFPYNFGEGTLNSIKGLGDRIYTAMQLSNRFLGQIFDGGAMAASLVVQPQTGMDAEKMQLLRLGYLSVLPPGLNAIQSSFMPNFEQLARLRTVSSEILNNNTGVFRPRNENPFRSDPEKTAAQVEIEQTQETRFEKNQAIHKYICWDKWHRETFRRLTNPGYVDGELPYPGQDLARVFVAKCENRGVPRELLLTPGLIAVKSTRSVGVGSSNLKRVYLRELMTVRGAMDEIGRRNTEREWAAGLVGYDNVDKYFPLQSRDKIPTDQRSIAMLENNDFAEGSDIVVGVDQDHVTHMATHFEPMVQAYQVYQQAPEQVDLEKILNLLAIGLRHIQVHMQYLAGDPTRKGKLDEFAELLGVMEQFYRDLSRQAEQLMATKQAQAQAQAQEMERLRLAADENTRKHTENMRRIELEHEARMADVASLNTKREIQLNTSVESMMRKAVNSMRNENMKAMNDIRNKLMKTNADVQAKLMKAGGATSE